MRPHLPIAVSILAVLLTFCVAACDATVEDAHSCAAECGEQNAQGLHYYNVVMGTCACSGCTADCEKSVCREKETPSNECLPCVQDALSGSPCNEYSGLFGSGCFGHPECQTYVSCLQACH